MSDYWSDRYGDLDEIAAHTDGDCHLCHEPADLDYYGPPGMFGDHTVTIDHVWPQAYGGDDDLDNLRLAHARCNQRRGLRDPEEVRMELVGVEHEPLGRTGKALLAGGATGAAYAIGGALFSTKRADGKSEFNHAAGAGVAAVVVLLALAAL